MKFDKKYVWSKIVLVGKISLLLALPLMELLLWIKK
jgi:hypothetical protein